MSLLYRYEFKNTLRFMLVLLVCALLACTVIQYTVSREDFFSGSSVGTVDDIRFFLIILSMLVFGGAAVTFFFYVSGLLSKDVFTDRGYLTMTLPFTGYQTIGAKTLLALTWYVILFAVGISYNLMLMNLLFPADFVADFYHGIQTVMSVGIGLKLIALSLVSFVVQVQLIYFAIILAKMTVSRYRLSGMWFILYLILMAIYERVQSLVFNLMGETTFTNLVPFMKGSTAVSAFMDNGNPFWVKSIVLQLVASIVLWVVNSLLWEKKVEI